MTKFQALILGKQYWKELELTDFDLYGLLKLIFADSDTIDFTFDDINELISALLRMKANWGLNKDSNGAYLDIDGLDVTTSLDAVNDKIVVHKDADNQPEGIVIDDFARRWKIVNNNNGVNFELSPTLPFPANFGTISHAVSPYEDWSGYQFSNVPSGTELLQFQFELNKDWNAGQVTVSFVIFTSSTVPTPPDNVKMGIQARAYHSNNSMNGAYGTIVYDQVAVSLAQNIYITPGVSLTINNASEGISNIVRGLIYRDNAVADNYAGTIYLKDIIVKWFKNKWSD